MNLKHSTDRGASFVSQIVRDFAQCFFNPMLTQHCS
jgi:hypothetical protein